MQDFTLSVVDLAGRPGEYKDFVIQRPVDGVRTALATVGDEPVGARLRAESVVEGILVTGTVSGTSTLECARCLESFRAPFELEVCELFVAPGHEAPDQEDAYTFTGLEIDLEPMIRDAVALTLPLNPVCNETCKGLCAQCGQNLNQAGCGCRDEDTDPRWAALADLRERLEQQA